MKFYSRSYKKVELFIRKTGKRNGTFLLECAGKRVFGTEVSNELFHRVTIVLSEHTAYHVVWENSQISQMYLLSLIHILYIIRLRNVDSV